jgi:hypothetical protein
MVGKLADASATKEIDNQQKKDPTLMNEGVVRNPELAQPPQ